MKRTKDEASTEKDHFVDEMKSFICFREDRTGSFATVHEGCLLVI